MHAMNSSDGASPQKSTRTQPPLVSSETWSSNSHLWPYLGLYLFDTQCDAESQVSPHLLNAVFIDLVNDRWIEDYLWKNLSQWVIDFYGGQNSEFIQQQN